MDLKEFFEINNKVALAFSGGVDSSYLLHAAKEAGADVKAYYVNSQFQPGFELRDARQMAETAGAEMKVIEADVLSDERVRSNPADRCYYCKRLIMGAITRAAAQDGYSLIIDGTNASDDSADRPGTKALVEFGVRSPLKECGITKEEIRRLSKEAGLPFSDKPAYACLATRILSNEEITAEKLRITEDAESILYSMGFRDFRVRMQGRDALVQIKADQYDRVVEEWDIIEDALRHMYGSVRLDEKAR